MIGWDYGAREWVVTHRHPALDGVMWLLSVVGRGGIVWLSVGAYTSWRRSRWQDFVTLGAALLLTTIVADHTLKPAINRPRPFVTDPRVRVIGGPPSDASFPSGHAANSFAGALVLSATVPEGRIAWWLLAVAIAYSRVYLGVHYPLDVLAGAIVGLSCAGIVLYVRHRRRANL
jgi:undecaprenyl-diphosphatase